LKEGTLWQTAEKATFSTVWAAMLFNANITDMTTDALPTASMWNRQARSEGRKLTAGLLCRARHRISKQLQILY